MDRHPARQPQAADVRLKRACGNELALTHHKAFRQATLERIRQNSVELDRSPEGGFGKLTDERHIG